MPMPRHLRLLACLVLLLPSGCSGRGGREPRTYVRPGPRDPVAEARGFFEEYANGQGVGSEQELFQELITAAKDADPAKAAVIERAFTEIQKRPAEVTTIAKRTLREL